jgi:hypothetical protein
MADPAVESDSSVLGRGLKVLVFGVTASALAGPLTTVLGVIVSALVLKSSEPLFDPQFLSRYLLIALAAVPGLVLLNLYLSAQAVRMALWARALATVLYLTSAVASVRLVGLELHRRLGLTWPVGL